MAAKKVSIGKKPLGNEGNIEDWVIASRATLEKEAIESSAKIVSVKADVPEERTSAKASDFEEAKPRMKRLTLDLTSGLHRAIKLKAVSEGVPMADLLRELLERHYG